MARNTRPEGTIDADSCNVWLVGWLVGCVFLSTRSHLNVNACLRYYCFCFNRVIVVFVCYCCVHVAAAAVVTFFLFIAHALPISCHDNITFLGILFHFNNLIVRLLKKKTHETWIAVCCRGVLVLSLSG